jgi:hypothetical protein
MRTIKPKDKEFVQKLNSQYNLAHEYNTLNDFEAYNSNLRNLKKEAIPKQHTKIHHNPRVSKLISSLEVPRKVRVEGFSVSSEPSKHTKEIIDELEELTDVSKKPTFSENRIRSKYPNLFKQNDFRNARIRDYRYISPLYYEYDLEGMTPEKEIEINMGRDSEMLKGHPILRAKGDKYEDFIGMMEERRKARKRENIDMAKEDVDIESNDFIPEADLSIIKKDEEPHELEVDEDFNRAVEKLQGKKLNVKKASDILLPKQHPENKTELEYNPLTQKEQTYNSMSEFLESDNPKTREFDEALMGIYNNDGKIEEYQRLFEQYHIHFDQKELENTLDFTHRFEELTESFDFDYEEAHKSLIQDLKDAEILDNIENLKFTSLQTLSKYFEDKKLDILSDPNKLKKFNDKLRKYINKNNIDLNFEGELSQVDITALNYYILEKIGKIQLILKKHMTKKAMNDMKDSLKLFFKNYKDNKKEDEKSESDISEYEDDEDVKEDTPEEEKTPEIKNKKKLGKSPMKTRRQLQLNENYKARKEIRKTFVPVEPEKMNLKELQAYATTLNIDINNKESGKGKGKGHKSKKTTDQLISEINTVRAKGH